MSTTTKEIVHQGWLTKSPPTKAIFRPRWRKRWFILKSGSYPNQFVLEYFTDESCRRQKGLINLDECEQVAGPLNVQDRHRYTFHLRTPSRTYYLAAESESEMNEWVQGICQVCGLKIIEDDNEGNVVYARPSNENTKPVEAEPTESHNESNGSSPTPSNKSPSGPYIPISECFTGKPINFNPNTNEEVTYYNTSSFPFPPKVNWATHPYVRDTNDSCPDGKAQQQGQRPNETSYAPPRPPKKSSSKPTTPTTTTVQSSKANWSPSPKCQPEEVQNQNQTAGHPHHSAGVYENVEENNPDSSSPSSSLHSPPGSAGGGLYCNIPDITESKTGGSGAAAAAVSANHNLQPATSPSPSCSSGNSSSAIPPRVDRNLKPEVKKANEINAALKSHQGPSASSNSQSRLGCMTLPNKSSQSNFYNSASPFRGPEIDRTRKPSDGHPTLSSTPAQLRYQSAMQNDTRVSSSNMRSMNTSTLPNSSRRRAGPLISPHDKKAPLYHEYETAQELSGTYMQIDCKAIKETESRSQTLKLPTNKKVGAGIVPLPSEGSVEYRLIDHVKTKALNQMRLDREKQLQTNTTRH